MSDCQRKARHPEEGGEWELATLKRVVNGEVPRRGATLKRVIDLPWWTPVFDSGTRRAVCGLKSAGAVVSNPGARRRAAGALAVSAQNCHLTRESGRLRRLLQKAPRWTGSWASNAHGHTGLNGLGLKTIATLFGPVEAWIR